MQMGVVVDGRLAHRPSVLDTHLTPQASVE